MLRRFLAPAAREALLGLTRLSSLEISELTSPPISRAKANTAAKRIGAGLMELDALEIKLAEKLPKIASEAFDAGRFEVARQAYV